MRRAYRIIPTYTGDVSGACSALFELSGMVVIHDPSGCNSTYNTHDETRWYDTDSLIFISGLIERDAILGNDEKLVDDVVETALALKPRFIALVNSPIPFIAGTDFCALARLIERRTNIPCFYVPTNGMHDYVQGASHAFAAVARQLVEESPRRPGSANVLGLTPLDFGILASPEPFRAFLASCGLEPISCLGMGSTLDEVRGASAAEVNLVVSATGLACAKVLRERFGTPYVVGCPIGGFADVLADSLNRARRTGESLIPCAGARTDAAAPSCAIIGEPVTMGSLAAAAARDAGLAARVVCPVEADGALLAAHDTRVRGEEEMEAAIAEADIVVADELLAPIVCARSRHITLAHQALSGRNGWPHARELTGIDVAALLA